ncbi:MAG TPA: nucleotide disphospho-sugar-binding domain-containing protein [Tepidisphaeraceae bacterium]
MRFETETLDLKAAAAECDAAVLHGGHGTTASLLLAGKPTLLLPLVLEQQMLAARVRQLGAGLDAPIDKPIEIVNQLQRLLDDPALARSARTFAEAHRAFDPTAENDQMIRCIERLCASLRSPHS